jgi:hypothetical protein
MKRRLSTVQVESGQWTVLSLHQTQLERKNPTPPIRKKKGDPFTLLRDFSLVAWKFYS